jgi:hypothetical protein
LSRKYGAVFATPNREGVSDRRRRAKDLHALGPGIVHRPDELVALSVLGQRDHHAHERVFPEQREVLGQVVRVDRTKERVVCVRVATLSRLQRLPP